MGNAAGSPPVGRVIVKDANDTTKSTSLQKQELAADIARTRAEMSGTIDQIQQKLDPEVLKARAMEKVDDLEERAIEKAVVLKDKALEQVEHKLEEAKAHVRHEVHEHIVEAKQAVRRQTIGRVEHMVQRASHDIDEASTTIVETIRANPIPAAMIGAGIAWLLFGANKKTTTRRSPRLHAYGAPPVYDDNMLYDDVYEGDLRFEEHDSESMIARGRGAARQVGNRAREVAHDARDIASSAKHRAEDLASTAKHRAEDLASTALHRAEDVVERGQETASELALRARREANRGMMRARATARRVETGFERSYRDNPLALGAAAIAVGTMVGLALPTTEKEDRVLGRARDRLVDKAQQAAEGALDKVSEKANERFSADFS